MRFFKENSYEVVRLMLYQFAMAVFGSVLTFATLMSSDGEFNLLTLAASILAVGLYLYILYAVQQELGSKDKIKVDSGRQQVDKQKGLKAILFAQIPNFIVLFFMLLGYLLAFVFGAKDVGTNMFAVTNFLMYFMQSMFNGIIGNITGSEATSQNCLYVFLLYLASVVPSILVCWGSYNMGLKDKKLFQIKKKEM